MRRALPFPDLPPRRRSRIHWPTMITIIALGIAILLVIQAVQSTRPSALPRQEVRVPHKNSL